MLGRFSYILANSVCGSLANSFGGKYAILKFNCSFLIISEVESRLRLEPFVFLFLLVIFSDLWKLFIYHLFYDLVYAFFFYQSRFFKMYLNLLLL